MHIHVHLFFVPRTGIEPAHPCEYQILSLTRLPVPPSGHLRTTAVWGRYPRDAREIRDAILRNRRRPAKRNKKTIFSPPRKAMLNQYRMITIGLLREGKIPADNRVALTPAQCKWIHKNEPRMRVVVQRSAD